MFHAPVHEDEAKTLPLWSARKPHERLEVWEYVLRRTCLRQFFEYLRMQEGRTFRPVHGGTKVSVVVTKPTYSAGVSLEPFPISWRQRPLERLIVPCQSTSKKDSRKACGKTVPT